MNRVSQIAPAIFHILKKIGILGSVGHYIFPQAICTKYISLFHQKHGSNRAEQRE